MKQVRNESQFGRGIPLFPRKVTRQAFFRVINSGKISARWATRVCYTGAHWCLRG